MYRQELKFVILLLPLVASRSIEPKFVTEFFKQKTIQQIAMFGCQEPLEAVYFLKQMSFESLSLSYLPINAFSTVSIDEFLKVNYYKLGVILDLDCDRSEKVLQHITGLKSPFNESYHWMMRATSEKMPVEIFESLPLSVNTEITVAMQNLNLSYSLYDVYNPSYRHGGKLNITFMGYWNINEGLTISMTQYKYLRRANLNGLLLNFSIVIDHPPESVDMDTYLTTPIDKHLDTMHRFNYIMIMQLKDYYNFSMNLMRGTAWGSKVNGTFNGILGDMVKGIVDISVTPFRWIMERLDVMEYTVSTWVAGPTVILRHPKKDVWTNEFFRPFTRTVWIITAILALINWFLLYVTDRAELFCKIKDPDIASLSNFESALRAALTIVAASCQQGSRETPQSFPGRLVFITLLLWTLMLFQFYSGNIVGSLLAAPPRFITTPQALLDSNIEFGAEDIAYNYHFFSTHPDPVVAELNKKRLLPNRIREKASYYSPEEGLEKVQKGGFAFFIDIATAYKIIEDTFNQDEICDLQEIRLIPPAAVAIGTAKHSPFKKMVTYGLRKIMERGMAKRLRHIWHHRRPICPESHNSMPTPVAFREFFPAVLMLGSGIVLAMMVMLLENLIRSYHRFVIKEKQQIMFHLCQKKNKGVIATIFTIQCKYTIHEHFPAFTMFTPVYSNEK
ncbi:hypothetical protein QAD02_001674 [Eretmocerus hayati]|uniref:Uncharacterized protein n=1 Tax=Eretmocerus hayati TaxID=131215 RepID=A0ACC2NGY1_9HYME|nr:hypothetical protein QAD02_001674 [Eretmocerus hayati]